MGSALCRLVRCTAIINWQDVHLQVRERQETVRDSRTGKESVTVTRNIGDRVRNHWA